MKKLLSLITVASLVLIVAGCKLGMRSEAYVSDLRAVAGGTTGITTARRSPLKFPRTTSATSIPPPFRPSCKG